MAALEDALMPSHHDADFDGGYAECTVCRSDTPLLCSPCGDPVCHNCACPNGCEAISAGVASARPGWDWSPEFPLDVPRQAA